MTKKNKNRYHVTTLAGSMRFYGRMMEIAEILSIQSEIVLVPIRDGRPHIPAKDLAMHAKVQNQRIDMSDSLTVINPDGYIGKSTAAEIAYAKQTGKQIRYLTPPGPEFTQTKGAVTLWTLK